MKKIHIRSLQSQLTTKECHNQWLNPKANQLQLLSNNQLSFQALGTMEQIHNQQFGKFKKIKFYLNQN